MTVLLVLLVLLVAASGLAYAIFKRDMARAYRHVTGETQIFISDCGPVEYALRGGGQTILLVHGAGGGFDQALSIGQPFLSAGYRVLAPSRFGYLRSAFPADPSPARQADVLAQLVRHLDLGPVVVVGVSAGAHSALELALRHPGILDALILIVPSAYHPGKTSAAPHLGRLADAIVRRAFRSNFLLWAGIRIAPHVLTRAILATDPALVARQPVVEQQRIKQMLWQILPVSLRSEGILADANTAASLGPCALEQISARTLTISAEDDLYGTYASARYVAEHVQRGQFVGFLTGGHMLAGKTVEMGQAVMRFLKTPNGLTNPDVGRDVQPIKRGYQQPQNLGVQLR